MNSVKSVTTIRRPGMIEPSDDAYRIDVDNDDSSIDRRSQPTSYSLSDSKSLRAHPPRHDNQYETMPDARRGYPDVAHRCRLRRRI